MTILQLSINPNVTETPTLVANVSSASTVPMGTLVIFNCTAPFTAVSYNITYVFMVNGRDVARKEGSAVIPVSYNYPVVPKKYSEIGDTLNFTCAYYPPNRWWRTEPSNSITIIVDGELHLFQGV